MFLFLCHAHTFHAQSSWHVMILNTSRVILRNVSTLDFRSLDKKIEEAIIIAGTIPSEIYQQWRLSQTRLRFVLGAMIKVEIGPIGYSS